MIIYLVRHGETDANDREVLQGSNEKLSVRGIAQADALAERFTRLPVDELVSSDYVRTRMTTERILTRVPVPATYSELFRERREPSSLIGMPHLDPRIAEARRLRDARADEPSWHLEDEENFSDLVQRGNGALSFLLARKSEHIVVVTHGMFLRVLLGVALFEEVFTPEIWKKLRFGLFSSNTGISILRYGERPGVPDTGWWFMNWNDHAHLG